MTLALSLLWVAFGVASCASNTAWTVTNASTVRAYPSSYNELRTATPGYSIQPHLTRPTQRYSTPNAYGKNDIKLSLSNAELMELCGSDVNITVTVKKVHAADSALGSCSTSYISRLQIAAAAGQVSVVEELLAEGALIDLQNKEGLTALQLAAVNNQVSVMRVLLQKGADLNSRTKNGSTILHLVISASASIATVKYILGLGNAALSVRNNEMKTPLDVANERSRFDIAQLLSQNIDNIKTRFLKAAEEGQLKNVTLLLELGAQVNDDVFGETALHKAVSKGQIEVVKYLVKLGAEVNRRDNQGETPLHKAVRYDQWEVFYYLIFQGVERSAQTFITRTSYGWTPLHYAVALKRDRIVETLLNLLDSNRILLPGEGLMTPLHTAAMNGDAKYVSQMLSRGVSVDQGNKEGLTAFHLAAVLNYQEVTTLLLQKGANINARTSNGSTVLHLVAPGGDLRVIKYLLERNASINVRNNNMETPMVLAQRKGHTEVAALLREKVGDISVSQLTRAAELGQLSVVKSLVKRGADVDGKDSKGESALFVATLKRRISVVQYLVNGGADVEVKNNWNKTPLFEASWYGFLEIVRFLLENKANLNAKSNDGRTPLHAAAENGQSNVTQYLLDRGADANAIDFYGWTPLHLAIQGNHSDVVKQLVKSGANVDTKNAINNKSPLYVAASNGFLGMVKYLVENGAGVNVTSTCKDNTDTTPLTVAARNNQTEIVKYLKSKGAA